MLDVVLAAIGALGTVVAALSGRLRQLPLSEPLLGLVAGVLLGPAGAGFLELSPVGEATGEYHDASQLLLAIAVMAVALRFPFQAVRRRAMPVLLLVAVAMPAMAALTAGTALLTLSLAPAAALLLGTALCPTDPVLASSAVTGSYAERDVGLRTRQLLSLESGANDALAQPLVLLALVVAGAIAATTTAAEAAWQLGGGILIGAVLGWIGGRALRAGEWHGATERTSALFFTLLLALGVLGVTELLEANGVLAVVVAGLAFNLASTSAERGGEVAIDEVVNRFVVLPLFLLIGAVLPWESWVDLGWRGPALAIGVLLLRRLPVLLALRRPLRLRWPDAVFLGWFGPVGVSALFYLTLEAERMALDPVLISAGMLVIAASTVAHGLTMTLGRRLYRRYTPEQQDSGQQSSSE